MLNQCRESNIDQHELTKLKMENRCSRRIIIPSFINDTCREFLFTTTVTETYLTFSIGIWLQSHDYKCLYYKDSYRTFDRSYIPVSCSNLQRKSNPVQRLLIKNTFSRIMYSFKIKKKTLQTYQRGNHQTYIEGQTIHLTTVTDQTKRTNNCRTEQKTKDWATHTRHCKPVANSNDLER